MPKKLLSLLALLVAICFAFIPIKDNDPFDALLERIKAYSHSHAQEKVHLHLDKPYYSTGDDIWFKAYVTNTETREPSEISHILYVELIDDRDSIKQHQQLLLRGGNSWGDFKLPDTLAEGNYRIRAYTKWMANAGPEYFFDKTIKIGNSIINQVFTQAAFTFSKKNSVDNVSAKIRFTDKENTPYASQDIAYDILFENKSIAKGKTKTDASGFAEINLPNTQPLLYQSGRIVATINLPKKEKVIKEILIKANSNEVDVQFFPESGNLIQDLPNTLGIKAINTSGLGENVEGVILDNNGDEVTRFVTKNLGMGKVVLNPQSGKTYTARVKFADGSERSVALPKIQSSGYILSINNLDKEKLNVKIMLSPDLVGPTQIKLVAQQGDNLYFNFKASSNKQLITTSILKKDIPSGILRFTLFSGENMPVAERLAFVNNPNDKVATTLTSSKPVYTKREAVTLDLQTTFQNKPVQGSFSISVTNTSSINPDLDNESNILTTLLLTSDLSGYIEKPNSYFLKDDLQSIQNLDELMLTQGWRRISWKNIISNTIPPIRYQPERSLKISGTILGYNGKPLPNSKVYLISLSEDRFQLDTLSDARGRFTFDDLFFSEGTKFMIQGRTEAGKKRLEIELDPSTKEVVTKNKNTGDLEVNVNEALQSYLQKSSNYFNEMNKNNGFQKPITLKEVQIIEKVKKLKYSANLNGPGEADFILLDKNLMNCMNILQCLQGKVPGITINNNMAYLPRSGGRPMSVVLDGVPISNEVLGTIHPLDLQSIEVLTSPTYTTIYSSLNGRGVILLTTRRDGFTQGFKRKPGVLGYNSPGGFYVAREFYSPQYTTTVTNQRSDLRTTVYWSPQVVTDENGKASINYFNTDEPGVYRIVLEGMDINGNLARSVHTYQVK